MVWLAKKPVPKVSIWKMANVLNVVIKCLVVSHVKNLLFAINAIIIKLLKLIEKLVLIVVKMDNFWK